MTDIINRIKTRAETLRLRGEITTPELLEEVAQLLQQGEAVAEKVWLYRCRLGKSKQAWQVTDDQELIEIIKRRNEGKDKEITLEVLEYVPATTPPDTQAIINTLNDAITEDKILVGINAELKQKLDKAREALQFYADPNNYEVTYQSVKVPSVDLAQQVLKDIE